MNISITFGLKSTEPFFDNLSNTEKIIMGDFFNEHILNKLESLYGKPKEILDLLSKKISTKNTDVLISYACDNIEQILYLSSKLRENKQLLHTVFIPSSERLLIQKEEELDFTNKHGNFASFSPSQIEEGYQEWQRIYEEIKRELPKYSIEVKEV